MTTKPLLQRGNTKLGRSIYQFSLPPIITCKPSTWCRDNCYACKGLYKMYEKRINEYFNRCYEISKKDSFVLKICDEIQSHKNLKYIRIHIAGDFYSPEYIEKWVWIAYLNPDIKFLAFTKRQDFQKELEELNELPNVTIRESIDSTMDPKMPFTKAIIQGSHKEYDGYACSGHCEKCLICWNTTDNVILPAH